MKILKIVANNFKLCSDDFTIDFVPTGNKMPEHKEYELHEIDEKLFVFTTMGVVGKNASGKTTIMDLLELVHDIASSYTIKKMEDKFLSWNSTINLDVTFYNNGYLYRYLTDLKPVINPTNSVVEFINQKIYKKKYLPTYHNQIYDYEKYDLLETAANLPKNTSILFEVLNDAEVYGIFHSCESVFYNNYDHIFNMLKIIDESEKIIEVIVKMFDNHVDRIKHIKNDKYEIYYSDKRKEEVTNRHLAAILSRGTTKGLSLYTSATLSLKLGVDLIIDEIENHFHKNLVINLINLYKDKSVNKKNATLIFTTHYPELLDTFGRTDNIYIVKHEKKITLKSMYEYEIRNDLSKSKKFFENVFGTDVDYEKMMDFKKELMK